MNFLVRGALIAGLSCQMIHTVSAGPLNPYRGKNRVIVATVPNGADREKVAAELRAHRAGINERDLKILDASPGSGQVFSATKLEPQQAAAVRGRLGLNSAGGRAEFVLIGKDGHEAARQQGVLNLDDWFALIDTMPMRRDEMTRQRKGAE